MAALDSTPGGLTAAISAIFRGGCAPRDPSRGFLMSMIAAPPRTASSTSSGSTTLTKSFISLAPALKSAERLNQFYLAFRRFERRVEFDVSCPLYLCFDAQPFQRVYHACRIRMFDFNRLKLTPCWRNMRWMHSIRRPFDEKRNRFHPV